MKERNPFLRYFRETCVSLKWLLGPFFILLLLVLSMRIIYSRQEVYFYINGLHTGVGDWLFPKITELGSTAACIVLTVILTIYNRRQGLMLGAAYILNSVVSFSLKALVAFPRPRPYFLERALTEKLPDIYYVPGITVLDDFRSFPSGHSVCAFTAATILSYYAKNKYLSLLYFLLAVLVAYSRMYMSHHFLEDVTAGAMLGIVLSVVWLSLIRIVDKRVSRP
ncbi:phosphatase PAP2 family protein [Chitinophaga sp. Mgbs1]|uniref:Phosphatase PAP2 family protein n=1 Tax=Chitinophaga solisilvae TaxID=1233460 RepID=A0A3S1B487_9BACT|nr:phosphatase PAP2 family protein [Chitinophaga solisilvae]